MTIPRTQLAIICTVLASALLVGRSAGAQANSGIEGDIYLTMQNGDTKKGAGITIFLIPDGHLIKQWVETECPRRAVAILENELHSFFLLDSLSRSGGSRTKHDLYIKNAAALMMQTDSLRKQSMLALHDLIARTVVDTVGSGINAHYHFDGIPAGGYVLFGEWKIGEYQYAWWAPVTLANGQSVHRDLDNSTEGHEKIYCGAIPDDK